MPSCVNTIQSSIAAFFDIVCGAQCQFHQISRGVVCRSVHLMDLLLLNFSFLAAIGGQWNCMSESWRHYSMSADSDKMAYTTLFP